MDSASRLALLFRPLRSQWRLLRPPSNLVFILRGSHGRRVADLDRRGQAQRDPACASEADCPSEYYARTGACVQVAPQQMQRGAGCGTQGGGWYWRRVSSDTTAARAIYKSVEIRGDEEADVWIAERKSDEPRGGNC